MVLHFAGVDSISAAERLTGLIVAIPRAERAALGEDEAYISDLIGCTLVDVAGDRAVPVGEIEDVDRTAGRGAAAGGTRRARRSADSLRQELPAQHRRRSQARGDGAAGRSDRPERTEEAKPDIRRWQNSTRIAAYLLKRQRLPGAVLLECKLDRAAAGLWAGP